MAVIRPAGLNEKRCIIRESFNLYNNIVTIGTYVGPVRPTEFDFVAALQQCIADHPALSVTIQDADTEHPLLVRAENVDAKRHIQLSPQAAAVDVQALLEELHNDPTFRSPGLPHWRVQILFSPEQPEKFHLAFACSHAVMDGMSGYVFHRSFLAALNGRPASKAETTLPLPLEQAGDLKVSWGFLLGPVINEYAPRVVARLFGFDGEKPKDVWLGAAKRPAIEEGRTLPTSVQAKAVSVEVMRPVLAACRRHGARLTGLLDYLVAKALSQALSNRGKKYSSFEAMSALDLRRCLEKGKDQMASYVSAVTGTITVQLSELDDGLSDDEWRFVSQLTARLGAASQTLSDQPVGLLKYLNNFKEWTLKNARAPADTSFEVSNLGVFHCETGQGMDWRVEDMAFSQSASGTGPALNINTASAKGGSLMMTGTWWDGMLGVEDETEFVKEVLELTAKMLAIIGGGQ